MSKYVLYVTTILIVNLKQHLIAEGILYIKIAMKDISNSIENKTKMKNVLLEMLENQKKNYKFTPLLNFNYIKNL